MVLRRLLRPDLGLCIDCGYDLRGSNNRCPECGLSNVPTPFDEAAEAEKTRRANLKQTVLAGLGACLSVLFVINVWMRGLDSKWLLIGGGVYLATMIVCDFTTLPRPRKRQGPPRPDDPE